MFPVLTLRNYNTVEVPFTTIKEKWQIMFNTALKQFYMWLKQLKKDGLEPTPTGLWEPLLNEKKFCQPGIEPLTLDHGGSIYATEISVC